MSSSDQQESPRVDGPLQVLYCQSEHDFHHSTSVTDGYPSLSVCTFPPEYCEFGSSLTRCKEWLQGAHPQLFDRYYSDGKHRFQYYLGQ